MRGTRRARELVREALKGTLAHSDARLFLIHKLFEQRPHCKVKSHCVGFFVFDSDSFSPTHTTCDNRAGCVLRVCVRTLQSPSLHGNTALEPTPNLVRTRSSISVNYYSVSAPAAKFGRGHGRQTFATSTKNHVSGYVFDGRGEGQHCRPTTCMGVTEILPASTVDHSICSRWQGVGGQPAQPRRVWQHQHHRARSSPDSTTKRCAQSIVYRPGHDQPAR